MNWLEILAMGLSAPALLMSERIATRAVAVMIFSSSLAVLVSDASGESFFPLARVLSFVCIFVGVGVSALLLLSQASRSERDVD